MNATINDWTQVVVNNLTNNSTDISNNKSLNFESSVSSRIFDGASTPTTSNLEPLTRKQKRNRRNNAYNKRKQSWMNTSNYENTRSQLQYVKPSTQSISYNNDTLFPLPDVRISTQPKRNNNKDISIIKDSNNISLNIESSFSSSIFDNASTSTNIRTEPFTKLINIPDHLLSKKQRRNLRTNGLKRLKKLKNNSENNRSQWDYVFKSTQQPSNNNDILCSRKEENKECSDSCAGSVYLEGSVNGIYLSDSTTSNKNPGPLESGEYEADWMSVCTDNHSKFRTHWKGYENHTLEPRCHLRNAPVLVNAAIDKYNLNNTNNKYKRKRAVLPNIPELLKINPLQCEICGKRESSTHRLKLHKEYIHEIETQNSLI